MTSHISLWTVHGDRIPFKAITFPGGEPHVAIVPFNLTGRGVWIDARIGDADGWMQLLALLDAVNNMRASTTGIFLPYFPGARQDRTEAYGAFTARLYADILTYLDPSLVLTVDPHSDVLEGLIENLEILRNVDVVPSTILHVYDAVISPDAGAERRASLMAAKLGVPMLRAHKKRDPATGKLSGFGCETIEPSMRKVLVVDDICDGGGTFVGLAESLCQTETVAWSDEVYRFDGALDLFVTHGIFSKGFDELSKYYCQILTTDSFPDSATELSLSRKIESQVFGLHEIAANYMARRAW